MYKQLGYSVYRTVIEYYSASNGEPDEDAYGKLPSIAVTPKRKPKQLHFFLQVEILF
jgi:N-terminal acetyltransferase B complex catalytic subunit